VRWALLMAAIALGVVLVACDAEGEPSPVVVAVQTQAEPRALNSACLTARTEGTLVSDPASGIALRRGDLITRVVWPFGFSGRIIGGRLGLADDHGVVVAWAGDHVSLGGGFLPPDETFHPCAGPTVIH
jgi:hypothetical protein